MSDHESSVVSQKSIFSLQNIRLRIDTWRLFINLWFIVLAGVVIVFTWIGWDYYHLPLHAREAHPLDDLLRSRGNIGHLLGFVGAVMIFFNFSYLMRKSRKLFKTGPLDKWLDFHMITGISAWVLLTFHATFHISRLLAVAYYGLLVVVVTGLIGRYIYAHIPKRMGGFIKSLRQLHKEYQELAKKLENIHAPLNSIMDIIDTSQYTRVIKGKKGLSVLPGLIITDYRYLKVLRQAKHFIYEIYHDETKNHVDEVWKITRDMAKHAYWIAIIKAVQNLMGKWRSIHKFLAWTLVVLFFVHMILVYLFIGSQAFVHLFKLVLPWV